MQSNYIFLGETIALRRAAVDRTTALVDADDAKGEGGPHVANGSDDVSGVYALQFLPTRARLRDLS